MKTFIFLILLAAFTAATNFAQAPFPLEAGVSQKLARWRAENYSDVRYKLNITLEKQAPLMKGEIEIRVNLTEEGAKNDLVLDWRTTQFEKDKDKPFAYLREANGKVFNKMPLGGLDAPTHSIYNEHLVVLKRFLKPGENVFKIQFASPIKTSGAAVTRYVDREDGAEYIYSLFVPSDASTAFPVFDQPDLKARFTLEVLAPKDWNIITNTQNAYKQIIFNPSKKELELPPKDYEWTFFEETLPISTYVFAFAAGEFRAFVDEQSMKSFNKNATTEFHLFVRKSQLKKADKEAKEVFRLNREGVKYLESYFDFKFPFPKYDLVLIPEFPFRGMEHAGATFLREDSIIFPSEPTANDFLSRANVIFHEAAHQWFGDTVTMKWFDDLWLKEGFAEFMAYKTLEKVMPEYNAWKAFYERNKPLAYLTDSTRGTTPIYQEIPNLAAAKSAYGNIVYRKAPSFLRQAEFYLDEDKFQTAVRAFLKKYKFRNAEWKDLVAEFEEAGDSDKGRIKKWAEKWVTTPGLPIVGMSKDTNENLRTRTTDGMIFYDYRQINVPDPTHDWLMRTKILVIHDNGIKDVVGSRFDDSKPGDGLRVIFNSILVNPNWSIQAIFLNYEDRGYGIFLPDRNSRDYILQNIQNEKDDFLRSMMWGALWDSVREAELNPKDYVELAIKNISVEKDELTIQTILARVSTAMNYYMSEPPASAGGLNSRLENLLIEKMQNAPTLGARITFYRAFLNAGSSPISRQALKDVLISKLKIKDFTLKTKDKFDIVTKLAILGDEDAPKLLEDLRKTEGSDDAKRYAYVIGAAFQTKAAKEKYFNDFLNNKEIPESWIESAFVPFNSIRHSEVTLPFLEKALAELPNLKRNRKIFFVNGWLASFIGGQKDEKALVIVNKFLADNPNLDKDLRLKILENLDVIERAVKIRAKYSK